MSGYTMGYDGVSFNRSLRKGCPDSDVPAGTKVKNVVPVLMQSFPHITVPGSLPGTPDLGYAPFAATCLDKQLQSILKKG
jgi:hypothetical protein